MNREPREFTDFSSGQDGWGNSILDETPHIPEPDDTDVTPEIEEITEHGTITVVNRDNFACTVDGSATFSTHLNHDSTI